MNYLIKDGSKSHIAIIALKWIFTAAMLFFAVRNFQKTAIGSVLYLMAGILINPLPVKNQKHKLWVILVCITLYLAAPRIVSLVNSGTLF